MSSSKVVVTIRGGLMPSVVLARGETRTVALTPRIQRLIDKGWVEEVSRQVIKPAPVKKSTASRSTKSADGH